MQVEQETIAQEPLDIPVSTEVNLPEVIDPPFEGGTPTDIISLDDLLGESMEHKAAAEAERDLRKKVAKRQGSPEELAADQALLRKWAMNREWRRTANVLSFNRQLCRCGAYHTTLLGKFELHANNRIAGATNMVAVPGFELDLPKQVHYVDENVRICHSCADEQEDWPLEDGDD